jgi:hypothetical protein
VVGRLQNKHQRIVAASASTVVKSVASLPLPLDPLKQSLTLRISVDLILVMKDSRSELGVHEMNVVGLH